MCGRDWCSSWSREEGAHCRSSWKDWAITGSALSLVSLSWRVLLTVPKIWRRRGCSSSSCSRVRDADADARHGARGTLGPMLGRRNPSRPPKPNGHKTTQVALSSTHHGWLVLVTLTALHHSNGRHSLTAPVIYTLAAFTMAAGNLEDHVRPMDLGGGTGARFAKAIIIVAGACALVASLTTFVCVSSLMLLSIH